MKNKIIYLFKYLFFNRAIIAVLLLTVFCFYAKAQPGTIDPTFNPADIGLGSGYGGDGKIYTIARQNDCKIIIGGEFTSYNGITRNFIARLMEDGKLDTTFNVGTGTDDYINAIAIQTDGKIIIGGSFHYYNGSVRNHLARLNVDGSLDVTFDPGAGTNGSIKTIAIQSDGKIIIGGYFTSYDGTTRNSIARLNANGTLDASFNPGTGTTGATGGIYTIAIQNNGKIIIGGYFTSFNGTTRNSIARLNANGSLDATFNPGTGANQEVNTTAIQNDGKIIIGGFFNSYNGVTRNRVARLNLDGTLDISFNPGTGTGASYYVYTTAIQSDGKIIIGGDFTSYNGTTRTRIARINNDGTLDATFNSSTGANSSVKTIVIQSDGKIIIGGEFTSYGGTARNRIALLNVDGTPDATFNPYTGANDRVNTTAIQSDGKIIIGGYFTSYNGIVRNRIARLKTDGTLDTTLNPGTGANSVIRTTAIQNDGKIIIGGDFTSYNGTISGFIARLNVDGTLDATFDSGTGADNTISTITIQSDGKIIIGGGFTSYNGVQKNNIARLNEDGTLDLTYNSGTGTNSSVLTTAIQTDGKILIGGYFTSYNETTINRIARLNTDGSLDISFNPGSGANDLIYTTAIQSDGKILVGGDFTSYNGTARNHLARLNADGSLDLSFNTDMGTNASVKTIVLQNDSKIITAGWFNVCNGIPTYCIARLNSNGTLDDAFNSGTGANNTIWTTALQNDGKIIIGGRFTSYNGTGKNRIARIIANLLPNQPSAINGLTSPCIGSSQNYSVTNVSGTDYTWAFPAGWVQTAGGITNSITVTVGTGSGNISVTPSNSYGTGTARTLAVTPLASVPAQPSAIAGSTIPCQGSSQNYSVTNIVGNAYTWTIPSGWIQTGGGTTNSIYVNVGSGSGNISVIPSNSCGNGIAQTLTITPISLPSQPSVIAGSTTPCQGSSQNYSVTNVVGNIYTWTIPSGWVQTGGGNTNSITVNVGSASGNISVTPSNSCGNGMAQTLAITTSSVPSQPSAISGSTEPCLGYVQNYSVTNVVGNIYTWTFPAGWTQIGGGTTNSVTVNVGSDAGNISVTPSNSCGSGMAQILFVTPSSVPSQPGAISGPTTPCQGSSQNYSVTNIAGNTYTWIFPTGWTQTGGGTTNSVTVDIGSVSGNIWVTPSNSCGNGTAQTLAVIPTNLPVQPDSIIGNITPLMGTSESYSVTSSTGVSYTWTFPNGWIQTSGGNTNAITAIVGGSGDITCTPYNLCGNGIPKTLAVTVNIGILDYTNNNNINIQPNPTNGIINLNLKGFNDEIKISVKNTYGGLLASEISVPVSDNYTKTIDLSGYANGIYFIQIENNGKVFVQKIVKL